MIDVALAASVLVAGAPVIAVTAAVVYADVGRPLLFRQRRVGLGGRVFELVKFRTMRNALDRDGQPLADAARLTSVGKFLRAASLDELPQLYNVLRGDMSLVGPRPLLVEYLARYSAEQARRHDVKPGITGLAQISLGYSGRAPNGSPISEFKEQLTNPFQLEGADDSEADDMRMKMLFDLAYSANLEKFSTFWATELDIIAKTPLVMLKGLGR